MSGPANRGKYAEGKIKAHLDALEAKHAGFTANRNPDAHAAGGRAQPVAGDFQAFLLGHFGIEIEDTWPTEKEVQPDGSVQVVKVGALQRKVKILYDRPGPVRAHRSFVIEVKETKLAARLPYQSYSADKVARIRVREVAGCECIVMLCHRNGPKPLWRAVPQSFFYVRDPEKPSGSWDLSGFPLVDYREALNKFIGVIL